MEGIKLDGKIPENETAEMPEQIYKALKPEREKQILAEFTPEQQEEIKQKQQTLSSLAYFIGKDFRIPIELNESGGGWYWDFKNNIIRIDPKDLLEKPMDYLRFVISHEGGHRRISRTDFIPLEEWKQPGVSFMMNSIEDPRDNNFVAESYPKFGEQMGLAYEQDLDFEAKAKEKAEQKLGYKPRFMQAGFEYIKQWFRETKEQDFELSPDLPEEVKTAVEATLLSAQDSWLRYPSRQEADKSEGLIRKYAELSYQINRDQIWPEFKKLVEADMEDQKMEELLKDMQKEKDGGEEKGEKGMPQELKDKLTPEEQQALEEAIKKAIEQAKKEQQEAKEKAEKEKQQAEGEKGEKSEESSESAGEGEPQDTEGQQSPGTKPIDLDSLSEDLKQKIKEYIQSLPEGEQKEIKDKAEKAMKEFEEALNEELQGKLSDNPEKKAERDAEVKPKQEVEQETKTGRETQEVDEEELKKYKDRVAKELKKDENVYERMRKEVLPLIDKLENDLREIFVERRARGWKSGFTTGKRIDIKRRIQEKAKSVPAMESKAWQKRELPKEKDYAISILVDLSGSMSNGNKIEETFKAVIVLSEVLNRLSINLEILGFNDRMYEYQDFGEQMSKIIREHMGGMLQEVNDTSDTGKARWNDDGWALEQASKRLEKQKADQKFLIVMSDGTPEESSMHPRTKYELGKMIKQVLEESDIRLIGLGIGGGTDHVGRYYPNSIANVKVEEMAEKLADLIKEVIANYQNF